MECLICKTEDGKIINLKCQDKYDHILCEDCIKTYNYIIRPE